MAGSNLVIQQPRNQLLDIADLIGKGAPIFFGSGETKGSQTSSLNPADAAQSDALIASFMQRANSTAQADNVVADILYRAQLAFAPVLGDEKKSGLYNTTVRKQMANEAIARATAASAQAVLEDQQRAAAQATQLQSSKNAASRTTTSTQKTGPQIAPGKAIAASLAAIIGSKGASALFKKGKDLYGEVFDKGIDSGSLEDASGNLYDMDNFASGGAADTIGSEGVASDVSFGGASSAMQLSPEDYAAIVNDAVIPEGGGVTADSLVQADNTGITTDVSGPDVESPVAPNYLDPGALSSQYSDSLGRSVNTFSSPVPNQVNPITGVMEPSTVVFPGDEVIPEVSPELDPGAFGLDEAASTGGDVAVTAGISSVPNLPYYSIANIASEGRITQNLMDAPILGPVLTGAGEAGADIINDNSAIGIAADHYAATTDTDLTWQDANPYYGATVDAADQYAGTNISDDLGNAADSFSSAAEDFTDSASQNLGNLGDTVDDVVPDGGGDSIICTEAVHQGLLSKELYEKECEFSHAQLHPRILQGYHVLAAPFVRKMRKDKNFAIEMTKWAQAWGELVVHDKWSFRAAAVLFVGVPLAFVTSYIAKPVNLNDFYRTLNRTA